MHTLLLEEEQPQCMSCSVIVCAGVALRFLGHVICKWNCYTSFPSEWNFFCLKMMEIRVKGTSEGWQLWSGLDLSSYDGIVMSAAGQLSSL